MECSPRDISLFYVLGVDFKIGGSGGIGARPRLGGGAELLARRPRAGVTSLFLNDGHEGNTPVRGGLLNCGIYLHPV